MLTLKPSDSENYCKRNTIDLDLNAKRFIDFFFVFAIIQKIALNPCLQYMAVKDSARKGFHLTLWCKKDCELCRLVFDDQERFRKDSQRRVFARNVLFDYKDKAYMPSKPYPLLHNKERDNKQCQRKRVTWNAK